MNDLLLNIFNYYFLHSHVYSFNALKTRMEHPTLPFGRFYDIVEGTASKTPVMKHMYVNFVNKETGKEEVYIDLILNHNGYISEICLSDEPF